MEGERNRQFLDMKDKLDKRHHQRERERASQEKRMAFFVGTIGKNANLKQNSESEQELSSNLPASLAKKLVTWKTDMHELERVRKPISFERLTEFLHGVNQFEGKDMDGVYLSGPDYLKYRKLLERVTRLQELLNKLKAIRIKGSLADLNKLLKFFQFLKELIEEFERRKGFAKRIGGGFVVFGNNDKLLDDLFRFNPKNHPKKKTKIHKILEDDDEY